MISAIWLLLGALGGAIIAGLGQEAGRIAVADTWERIRGRKGAAVDLVGTWHAVWQTTVRGELNINTEIVQIERKGRRLKLHNVARSSENPLGGYLWEGEAELHASRHLVGTYKAKEKEGTSHGAIFFVLNPTGQFLLGRWVGCNIDREVTTGYGVLARSKEFAEREMRDFLQDPGLRSLKA